MLRTTSSTTSPTRTPGRRGAAIGASAAVVCLGALLAACAGGSDGDGYVAVGAAGATPSSVKPTGSVRVVPLEEEPTKSSAPDGKSPTPGSTSAAAAPAPDAGPSADGADSGRTTSSSPSSTPPSSRTTSPAALTWDEPSRAATDERWCEDVTLVFHNSGGTAVRSGSVTFGTHIIGALGIDWGTVESEVALPAPIEAGARKEKTWTVCVDEWRVPLGMRIETQDVDVQWK